MKKVVKSIMALIIGHLTVLKHCFKKSVTLEYPEKKPDLNERFRGEHALNVGKCTGCGICQKVCPVNAISIEKVDNKVTNYNIDLTKCIFCGNCTYYCPQKAIQMTKNFELATLEKSTLNLDINNLKNNFSDNIISKEDK